MPAELNIITQRFYFVVHFNANFNKKTYIMKKFRSRNYFFPIFFHLRFKFSNSLDTRRALPDKINSDELPGPNDIQSITGRDS